MKYISLLFMIGTVAASLHADNRGVDVAAQLPSMDGDAVRSEPIELCVDRIENIYIGPKTGTTLLFKSKKPIDDIVVGSDIVKIEYDEATGVMDLFANNIGSGKTNMRVIIDGVMYHFMIEIVNDPRVMYGRTFTFAGEAFDGLMAIASKAAILRPDQLDTVTMQEVIDRIDNDKEIAKANPTAVKLPLNKRFTWNNSPVTLRDVTFFANVDTLVFRIERTNTTRKAQYLHRRQYVIRVANEAVPITASTQLSSTLLPGQTDITYLYVQGHRLVPMNNWRLELPPEAPAIREVLESRR